MTRYRPAAVFPLALLAAGCGRVPAPHDAPPAVVAAAAKYPVRTDLMAVGNLGAPTKWPAGGFPPLRGVRLGPKAPDPEYAEKLRPLVGKDILDPVAGLSALQRDDLGRFLDAAFGSPAAPAVRVPTKDDAARLKLEELFAEGLPRGKTAKDVTEEALADAEKAKAELHLDDASLARGGVLYRRWCLQCHGPTGAGDGEQAVQFAAMPRDYRQGVFKFVSAFPTAAQTKKGEKGKARKEDIRRTVRNGLDGSMMPPFNQLTDEQIDDLAGYVIHLAARGETEFEVMAKAMKPGEDDPEFTGKELERLFTQKLLLVLGNWAKAEASPIPVPPENCDSPADRTDSALRGYALFMGKGGCIGCHADFGRAQQLKYDVWGTVVQPRNLVLGVYRGGRKGEDLYARVYGGIYASTMPDFPGRPPRDQPPTHARPDDIWNVVHFLQALGDPKQRVAIQDPDLLRKAKARNPADTVLAGLDGVRIEP